MVRVLVELHHMKLSSEVVGAHISHYTLLRIFRSAKMDALEKNTQFIVHKKLFFASTYFQSFRLTLTFIFELILHLSEKHR